MKTPCAASPPPFRLTCRVKRTKIYLDCAASAASVLQTSPNYSTKIPRIPVPTPHDQNATHTRAPNRSSSVLHRGGATEFVLSTRTDSLTASDRSVMQSLAPTHAPLSSSPSHAALRPYLLYGPPPLERLRARQRDFLAPRQMALNTISNWGLLQTVQPTNQNIKQQADTLDKQRAVCFREVGSKETRKYVDAHL
jgi:hypothetical protein